MRAFVEPKPFAVRTVDDTATVVVAMGHEVYDAARRRRRRVRVHPRVRLGRRRASRRIAQELDVHPAEAATILRHLSLSGTGRHSKASTTTPAKALDAIGCRLTPFARELVSSLQFYQTQPDSLGIGEIVITGGTSHLEGLVE